MADEHTFRMLTAADIPIVVDMVATAIPEMPSYRGLKVSKRRIEYVLSNNINNATFYCLLVCDSHGVPHGGIAGQVTMLAFSEDPVAVDILFFVEKTHRSLYVADKLIDGYTKWAKARKCALITGTHRSGERSDGVGKLLERHGYKVVGMNYHLREGE